MKTEADFQIIDGKFLPENAKEVIVDLIQSKINFHHRHRLKGDLLFSERRISELQIMLNDINNFMDAAVKSDKKIIMEGFISMRFVD